MDYNYNYSYAYSVLYFIPTSLEILPTWHIITLINQVCQIGLIQINICPNPTAMNKNGTIITTLCRVSGDTIPLSLTTNNQVCQIGLIRINIFLSLNTMKKIGTIVTTLHRVSGDTIPPSHIVNHLTNIQLNILLLPNNQ